MYMRIVRAQPPEGQADELARKWKAFVPERLRAQPGFRHAHFGIDRVTGATAAVTVFDDKPDDAMLERIMREFRDMLAPAGDVAQDAAVSEMQAPTASEQSAQFWSRRPGHRRSYERGYGD